MKPIYFLPIFAVLGIIVLSQSMFTVAEWEQAVVTQFGRPVRGVTEPGLKFKTPFVQEVTRYEKRLLRWDGPREEYNTGDLRAIDIDVTARWRITDPVRFKERMVDVERADRILNGIIRNAVQRSVREHELYKLVRSSNVILELERDLRARLEARLEAEDARDMGSVQEAVLEELDKQEFPRLDVDPEGRMMEGRRVVVSQILVRARAELEAEVRQAVEEAVAEHQRGAGMQVEDILLKTFNYHAEVEPQVYEQMNERLMRMAESIRSAGRGDAERRLGEMARELDTIQSEAQRDSERIRGEGDAEATEIYARSYLKDPAFYAFLRTLEAQRKAIGANHTLVIGSDSPFYQVLQDHQLLDGRH